MGKINLSNFSLIKLISFFALFCMCVFSLSGCGATGEKTASLLIIYIITTVFSFVMLLGYFVICKKKSLWFILLYLSILVVNIGYLTLSLSGNLQEALLANRIAYLGSVFLPLAMFMIIINVSNINYKKFLPYLLTLLSIVVFIIAASPGYSDIYYKEVYFVVVNGVSTLEKVYGVLHITYLIYLLAYFGAMTGVIVYSVLKRKNTSYAYPVILEFAVFINIGLWLLEQFIKTDFEMLAVSYIITGMFLLGLNILIKDNEINPDISSQPVFVKKEPEIIDSIVQDETLPVENNDLDLTQLTKTERMIYDFYVQGKSTKEIMAELNITENTLKYHNKNIYGKLGVSSRKELVLKSKN